MKNVLLLSTCLFFLAQGIHAQSYKPLKPTAKYVNINAGLGLLPTFLKDAGKMKVLPMSLSADYKLAKNFSLGAYIGHSVTETDRKTMRDGTQAKWRNSYVVSGIRMAAQSKDLNRWNIYGGMSVGYSHSSVEMLEGQLEKVRDNMGVNPASGKILVTGFVGSRYAFNQKVGLFGEIGMGVSLATAGLSIRL
jgi:acetolactate synthase regulatory subunit